MRLVYAVQSLQLLQMSKSLLGSFFCLSEQLLCALREGTGQSRVTSLAHDEVTVAGGRLLGLEDERILALSLQCRVEAEHIPVTAVNSLLHFLLAVGHAALDGVHLTGSVTDDEGRTMVSLCLSFYLDGGGIIRYDYYNIYTGDLLDTFSEYFYWDWNIYGHSIDMEFSDGYSYFDDIIVSGNYLSGILDGYKVTFTDGYLLD